MLGHGKKTWCISESDKSNSSFLPFNSLTSKKAASPSFVQLLLVMNSLLHGISWFKRSMWKSHVWVAKQVRPETRQSNANAMPRAHLGCWRLFDRWGPWLYLLLDISIDSVKPMVSSWASIDCGLTQGPTSHSNIANDTPILVDDPQVLGPNGSFLLKCLTLKTIYSNPQTDRKATFKPKNRGKWPQFVVNLCKLNLFYLFGWLL